MKGFLINSLYTVKEVNNTENAISASILLNANHEVFKGHFPSIPVVPGVCQVQILKEFLEENTGKELLMIAGDNIKFTGMILPDKNPEIKIELTFSEKENLLSVDGKLFFDDTVFTKYKGKFKILA